MRGGRRPGAGRPRGSKNKPEEPAVYTLAVAPGRYEPLAQKPGVVILDRAERKPSEEARLGLAAATVTQAASVSKFEPYAPRSSSEAYASMNKYYREYRRDELVRACVNIIAQFAVGPGFETAVEPEPNDELKAYVDSINKRVNMDNIIRIAIVNAKIYGKAAFEIVLDEKLNPERLIPLNPDKITPHLSENWELLGFDYGREELAYRPEQILYFANNCLAGDLEGISDIEPLLEVLETRRMIVSEALRESATVMWAGVGIHRLDTSGVDWTKEQIQQIIRQHVSQIKPGKHIATTARWDIQIVDLKPNIDQLIATLEYLDQAILSAFQVPKFLVGREKQVNRATAYAELESFVQGPVREVQRWIKRELEAQWYDRLVRRFLGLKPEEETPVRVVHKWNPTRTSDFIELVRSIAQGYGQGLGFLTREKAWELLGLNPEELKENEGRMPVSPERKSRAKAKGGR